MSSRILSAYFDDFRNGKKEREELRRFMEEAIRKEPMRRGHFMGWLDQAQYEHPIPVTEFLLLRKEIEATLDNDDQTRIVHPVEPVITSPDAETLVAGDEEATIMAPRTHAHPDDATEISSGSQSSDSQPSDVARQFDVPTLIAAPAAPEPAPTPQASEQDATLVTGSETARAMTLPKVTAAPGHASPLPQGDSRPPATEAATTTRPEIPTWLWICGILLVSAVGLGYWATRPVAVVIAPEVEEAESLATTVKSTPPVPTQIVEPEAAVLMPTGKTEEEEPLPKHTAPVETQEIQPIADDLSAADALALLQQRIEQGNLLPLDSPASAQAVLRHMEAHLQDQEALLQARVTLKDAYVTASKKAQGQGRWDDAQQLLDAAFEVLNTSSR